VIPATCVRGLPFRTFVAVRAMAAVPGIRPHAEADIGDPLRHELHVRALAAPDQCLPATTPDSNDSTAPSLAIVNDRPMSPGIC